ncbi:MAG: GFA family protein [Desulfobacterales bacterium]|nr:GFA family protein [Desulfobacterales bacterium]
MKQTLTGGCLCGAVRYELKYEPKEVIYCHCNDCKKATGGPYSIAVEADAGNLQIKSGQPKQYAKKADNGSFIIRKFCPDCGSPVFTIEAAYPDTVWIEAGTLDDPESVTPTRQIWTKRIVSWSHIDKNLSAFPEED